jgi:hypothetical protein
MLQNTKTDGHQVSGDEIDRAVRRAVQRALWVHKQLGNPICAWRDGKVVWIQPEDIPVQQPPDD